jgi:hypothetical protein
MCPPMLFKLHPCIQKLCIVCYPPTPSLGWIGQIKGRSLSLASLQLYSGASMERSSLRTPWVHASATWQHFIILTLKTRTYKRQLLLNSMYWHDMQVQVQVSSSIDGHGFYTHLEAMPIHTHLETIPTHAYPWTIMSNPCPPKTHEHHIRNFGKIPWFWENTV